jgi:tetratricopeptide (TPR) repeat protein
VQAAVATFVLLLLLAVETRDPYDELRVNRQLAMSAPTLPMAQRNYADALRKSGAYQEARQAYGNAIQLDREDADSLHGYGLTLASLGRRDEAVKFFEQAAIKNPGLRSAHYNAASLLVREGQTQRALAHFRQAFPSGDELALRELEKDPAAGEVLTNMALGLLQSGNRDEAMNLLRRAVHLDPRNGPAQLNLGSLLVMMGDVREAQVHYQAAVDSGDASVRAAAEKALVRLR